MPIYDISFRAEANFSVRLEMSEKRIAALKARATKQGRLLGGDNNDVFWIQFLIDNSVADDFDYILHDTDIDEMIITEMDGNTMKEIKVVLNYEDHEFNKLTP